MPANKKEVSCKALDSIFYALKNRNLDESMILSGVPYEMSYLKNWNERIEWWVWCKIITNVRPYFSDTDFEEMGVYIIESGNYIIGIFIAYFLFSTNKFSRLFSKQIFKLAEATFSCIKTDIEYLDKNKIRVTGSLNEGYELCPEFWLIYKGTWRQSSSKIGHKSVFINLTLEGNDAIFDVSWGKETLLFRFKRGISWLFNIKKAFIELNESHQKLLNQYENLDQSKKLLQKQTTQLKTAHEISTSIKQSLNINDTLKAIADALVKEAGFSAAYIELCKDIDENDIKIKFQSGVITEFVTPIHQEINVNDKKIGDLLIYPKPEMDLQGQQ